MNITSVTGGNTSKPQYSRVVIMLHGGGSSSAEYVYNYQQGWFGNLTGIKYVFPTSPLQGHTWYRSYKNGCGLADDCAYDISSIQDTATKVATLIDHEKALIGGDNSKVYLAGFSQGAQLTGYIQLAHLQFALGGVFVMDGFPLPPLCDMPGQPSASAKRNATYYGSDMRWMIYHGASDPIFPVNLTMKAWNGIFDALGIRSTLQEHIEPGMTHTTTQSEFGKMIDFIRNKE